VHPAQKDDTDTMLAVRHACEKKFSQVWIYGGLGGRLDHTLANVQVLCYLAGQGVVGTLVGETDRVTMQLGGTVRRYPRREGWYFSLFSFSETCSGVSVSGVEYPLCHGVLRRDFPLGVSNHILEDAAEISLQTGILLVVESYASEPNPTDGNIMR
jgi:thiamine pyrophosphokinase